MSLVIKANIDNVDDLPKIDNNLDINIYNLIKTITDKTAKKKLIIELLNKDLMKYTFKKIYSDVEYTVNFPINSSNISLITQYNEVDRKIVKYIRGKYRKKDFGKIDALEIFYPTWFESYPDDINFLHLVIYHHININKLLRFLLTIFYKKIIDNHIIQLYTETLKSATKFDFYNFDFTQDYETLFLSDYETLFLDVYENLEDSIIREKNKQLGKTMNTLIEENKKLNDLIKELNESIKKLNKNVEIQDDLREIIKNLSRQVEVYKTIVNNLVEKS